MQVQTSFQPDDPPLPYATRSATDSRLSEDEEATPRVSPAWKAVYTILDRGARKHWLRIGMAFVNRDGSLTVRLDAMPLTGQLHIRDAPAPARDGNGAFPDHHSPRVESAVPFNQSRLSSQPVRSA